MRKRIGDIFIEKGLIDSAQLEEILVYGKKNGLRFGDAALALGLIDTQKLSKVFGPTNHADFFYLDPIYFPYVTKSLFESKFMLRYGLLPLGFKHNWTGQSPTKSLNLGLLNPDNKRAVSEAEQLAKAQLGQKAFQGTRLYLILGDQFIDVFKQVYGWDEKAIREAGLEIDPLLEAVL